MIIGISGKIGSGKDTVAEMIMRDHLHGASVHKFAGAIKECAAIILGCKSRDFEDRDFKNKDLGPEWDNMTPRKILQLLGTEAGRKVIHPNIWVNATLSSYREGEDWIITDVRFPNEADAIRNRGGFLIRIEREVDTPAEVANHPSETSLDNYSNFHYIIDNRLEGLDSLKKAVDYMMGKIKENY